MSNFKLYMKQAWNLMKQNKLFTGIYVVGTALSIAMTMTVFIVLYVKFAPIYPEYNRDRTLVLKHVVRTNKDKSSGQWGGDMSHKMRDMLCELPHLDKIGTTFKVDRGFTVTVPQSMAVMEVSSILTDKEYWEVFTFQFVTGRPFTEAEVNTDLSVVILSESMAKRLTGSAETVGKFILVNGKEHQICGVVKDASTITSVTSADIYLPLSCFQRNFRINGLLGDVHFYMTSTEVSDNDLLKAEVQDVVNRYTQEDEKYEWNIMGQPDEYWRSTFRNSPFESPDMKELLKGFFYILLALLFIPALNLSGMISSRMNRRMAEFGVRKSYGATNVQIIGQVLSENLFLTCMGGILGILFSYIIVLMANEWIMYIFSGMHNSTPNDIPATFTFEMLFNPTIFLLVFGLCLVLNLISALVPTIWALHRPIVECLYTRR